MKQPSPSIERLKSMISLEEKRSALQRQLDAIHQQLTTLQSHFFHELATTAKPASPAALKGKVSSGQRARRGALSENILSALSAAGDAGIRVRDLSAAVGAKATNIHSWFQSTAKRHPSIQKLSAGVYRLVGGTSPTAAAPAKAVNTKGRAQRSPATKAAEPVKKKGASGKRGALAAKVMAALEGAGSTGLSVKDLAAKVGSQYKNISIWFATTGKKKTNIKKVGPAHYALVA